MFFSYVAVESPSLHLSNNQQTLPMDSSHHDMDVSIIDKDESSDRSYHVVDGFVIEDSKDPFPANGQLSFVPQDYGKEKLPTHLKRTRQSSQAAPKSSQNPSPIGDDILICEYCKTTGAGKSFLAPSRRFCSMSCCKRYSAEKRYYPYGKDEEGIAKAINEGLINPRSKIFKQSKHQAAATNSMREQRRRKMASFDKDKPATPNGGASTSKSAKTKRHRPTSTPATPAHRKKNSHRHVEPPSVEMYVHPSSTPLQSWTSNDVTDFLTFLGYEAYVDRFLEHEVDGHALSLMKDYHLLMTLKLRLGPALKIYKQITALKALEDSLEID